MTPETKRLLILVGAALLTSLASVLPQLLPGAFGGALAHAFSNIALVMIGVPINVTGQPTVKNVTVAVAPPELASAPEVER